MLKKILHKLITSSSKREEYTDKTMIYAAHSSMLLIISTTLFILSLSFSDFTTQKYMIPTQVVVTIALFLGGLQVFIRFLDVLFEAIKYEHDKRNT